MIRQVNHSTEPAAAGRANELSRSELETIAGGSGCASASYATVGLGLRKSAGNQASGVMFL